MLKGVQYQILQADYNDHGVYVIDSTEDPGVYIGDWRIDADRLYHRHPQQTYIGLTGEGIAEYDVLERHCWQCGAQCPDEIWFAHRLRQL